MKKNRYVVSLIGRFIFFDIAEELYKQNKLVRLYTSYPKFFFKKNYNIPINKIKSFSFIEILKRINERLLKIEYFNLFLKKLYGRFTFFFILQEDFDAFIFFTGNSFYSKLLNKLKIKKKLIIAVEGSTHALYRYKFLKNEYEKSNQIFNMEKQNELIKDTILEYEISDYIIVPSNFVKNTFLQQGIPKKKIITIPFGLNIQKFKKVPRKDKKFKIIFVGGITLRKGIDYLIDAIISLKNEIDLELWLIGHIDNLYKINKYPEFIKFFNHINKDKLPWYYSQCDIFCHPSLEEGLPATILEAMSIGLPIICTKNSGGGDVINNKSGFLIDAKSSDSIKEKILVLYNDKNLLMKMGAAAKTASQNNFNWSSFINKLNNEINV